MIQFDRVSKQYNSEQAALSNVSFTVDKGEMVFITGHSGAGKSTLLKLLALLERPSSGQIFINQKPIQNLPARAIPFYRRQIGVVFQDHQLLLDRSVADNVALPLRIAGYPDQEIERRVSAILDKVSLLSYARVYPQNLSGGEQQRVGIARAMVGRPSLLLADEPTGNLDPELSSGIMELFARFAEVGATVLIASHNLALIRKFRNRVLNLHAGYLKNDQTPADIPRFRYG